MKVKLIITESGKAKTLNPLGKHMPKLHEYATEQEFSFALMEWKQAESERIEYKVYKMCQCQASIVLNDCDNIDECFDIKPGTIVEATIKEGRAVIC